MLFKQSKIVFLILLNCLCAFNTNAQNAGDFDKKAFSLLENALGKYIEQESMAMYFEGVADKLSKPQDIFSLPVFKLNRGGYFLSSGKKYELQLATMKGLCDGHITVLIDEAEKTMMVDSLQEHNESDSAEYRIEVEKLMNQHFKEADLSYEGEVLINNKKCHKIRSNVKNENIDHVYYFVEVLNGKLLLMAESQAGLYTSYWFNKIDKVNPNHEFKIYLPNRKLNKFHGYKVYDNRFWRDNEN